jgi:hypothetical protein
MEALEADAGWAVGTGWQQFGKISSVEAWLALQDVLRKTKTLNLVDVAGTLRLSKHGGALAVREDLETQLVWLPFALGCSVSWSYPELFLGAIEYEIERREHEAARSDQKTV